MIPPRLPEETPRAHAAFAAYCRLGPNRSLAKVWQNSGKKGVRRTLEDWSTKYRWQERVAEYDAAVEKAESAAEEKALMDRAEKWAKRKIDHKEKRYRLGEALVEAGKRRLKRIFQASLGDAARAIQIGETMMCNSLDLPTGKTVITGPDDGPVEVQSTSTVTVIPVDPTTLTAAYKDKLRREILAEIGK